jgi:molecular chaperone GrpE (heat shock protein)
MDITHGADDPAPSTEQPQPEEADGAAADLQADPELIRAMLAERQNQYVRLAADFENFRRRKAQELSDRVRYGSGGRR